jgi:hypothetical protein
MRIILTASGSQKKWEGHLGVPSHFAPLTRHGGQPLIERTIEQLQRYGHEVHITVPLDPRYGALAGTKHLRDWSYPSEYAASRDLWDDAGRTVLLLGDVYFSDQAIERIMLFAKRQYMVFGRFGPSAITGTPYGEIFAASWWGEHHQQMDKYLANVHKLRARGAITRPPGWMLLRSWQRTPLQRHKVLPKHFIEINDETDDIDFPVDYERHPATRSDNG